MTDDAVATRAYRAARDRLSSFAGDPRSAAAEFRWPDVGPRFNWAVDWFDAIARGNDREALVVLELDGSVTRRTFDQLSRESDRLAAWLAQRGVGRGDVVVLMLGNQVELWQSMLAIMKLGGVVLPTAPTVRGADLRDRVARSGARHVICDAGDVEAFADVDPAVVRVSVGAADGWRDLRDAQQHDAPPAPHPGTAPDDPLLFYFTSGTTSRPKLVEHSQVSYPVGHLPTAYWLGLRAGDRHLNISSPGWGKHAWSCFFAPWIAESTVLVYNYQRFEPARLLAVLREQQVTTLCAPPTVWRMLVGVDLGDRPAELRELIGAGEPLNPEVISEIRDAWGLTVRDGYGQTETTAQVGNVPGAPIKPGSMGLPLPGVPVVLVDPVTGERIDGVGEGELCLDLSQEPLALMTQYRDDPERDAQARVGGYYHTGDVAERDADGYITFIGRSDDVFKSSDYKISPFELESVLVEHPAVAEAAVVPVPDPLRLAVPKAYVALASGVEPSAETARSILAHARTELNAYQRVRRIEFAELPKTISGKIRRVELREREAALAAVGETAPNEWREEHFPDLRDATGTLRTARQPERTCHGMETRTSLG
ncbi:AMP-binding protein [Microbacterium sp. SORGH_AS_0888]|uniref:AMP-binding protein n=1 Tax=Microbacterium sp. SORGH_AS_0888 TaxID=3041791 RepID=UPI002789913D|nr:AMP-binding protein [Microbacterium sp. SORGH_AS_0888]MDQ1128098.1 acetyl-CoA synthetase [Microbacterium sp. SORGH_AS_0888]